MRLLIAAASTLLLAGPLAAQGAAAARADTVPHGPVSAAKRAAIDEMLRVMDMEKTYRDGVEASLAAQSANPAVARHAAEMRAWVMRVAPWDSVKADAVQSWSDLFTETEIRQLTDFYRTPVGRKVLSSLPEMMRRTQESSQRRMQAHMPELMQIIMSDNAAPAPAAPKPD
ncbi:MAG: hypothetical protein JWM27_1770 [Gemmatimonadetes bacterium]|nr:hypothetical protein [Gemmatimonadota bacterium]